MNSHTVIRSSIVLALLVLVILGIFVVSSVPKKEAEPAEPITETLEDSDELAETPDLPEAGNPENADEPITETLEASDELAVDSDSFDLKNTNEPITWILEDSDEIIENPDLPNVLVQKIPTIKRPLKDFILLKPSSPVNDCTSMLAEIQENGLFQILASFMEFGCDDYREIYYKDSLSSEEVFDILVHYHMHLLPSDIAEWEYYMRTRKNDYAEMTVCSGFVRCCDFPNALLGELTRMQEATDTLRLNPYAFDCRAKMVVLSHNNRLFSLQVFKKERKAIWYEKKKLTMEEVFLILRMFYEEQKFPEDLETWPAPDFDGEP